MTAFDVDVDELRRVVSTMGACQRALVDLGSDIEAAQTDLHDDWRGESSDSHALAYSSWRDGCADMVTALAALRGVGETANGNYRAAVGANLAMWEQVG